MTLRYLHTLIRVNDLDEALSFYQGVLGMVEVRRMELEQFRFTNVFLAAPHDVEAASSAKFAPTLELCWYWDEEARNYFTAPENRFGHLAYRVDDIYAFCQRIKDLGLTINLPPRNGLYAVFTTPDGTQIEVVQEGGKVPPQEPWASMPDAGARAV
jgi:lactoylglutathione lyase